MRLIVVIAFCLLFLVGCETDNKLTFGTFNIAWLGDGVDDKSPRMAEDYQNIKSLIESLEVDVLALQEIENYTALQKVVDTTKYRIITSSYPKEQKTALIINKSIVIVDTFELSNISLGNRDLRPGLVAYCKYKGADFFVGSFHFKSTSRYDDTPLKKTRSYDMRREQSTILLSELERLAGIKSDKDFILLGDFNDNPTKDNSNITALENDDYDFLTSNMNSCKFPIWKSIDHIIISKDLRDNVVNSTLYMLDINSIYSENVAKKVSDHCPVIVQLNFN